jgi:hypothetical protein
MPRDFGMQALALQLSQRTLGGRVSWRYWRLRRIQESTECVRKIPRGGGVGDAARYRVLERSPGCGVNNEQCERVRVARREAPSRAPRRPN